MWLDRLFFTLLVLFLPSQLALHFFSEVNIVRGRVVDYLIPQVYFTDTLLILTIVWWIYRLRKRISWVGVGLKLALVNLIFVIHIQMVSYSEVISLIWLVRLNMIIALVYYIVKERISVAFVLRPLVVVTLVISILAGWQFSAQRSVGGWWYLLGERTFTVTTPGVARANLLGRLVLRPYATFPHPNVLGAFGVIVTSLILVNVVKKKGRVNYYHLGIFLLLFVVVVLSQSRGALLAMIVGMIASVGILHRRQFYLLLAGSGMIILLGGGLIVGSGLRLVDFADESYGQRIELIGSSLKMIVDHRWWGVGVGNFLVVVNNYLEPVVRDVNFQPVHNVFLLVGAETGLVGLTVFVLGIIYVFGRVGRKIKKERFVFQIIFWQVMALLSIDHYFYTLWQGQLLLSLIIGLMLVGDGKINPKNIDVGATGGCGNLY